MISSLLCPVASEALAEMLNATDGRPYSANMWVLPCRSGLLRGASSFLSPTVIASPTSNIEQHSTY